MQSVTDAQRTWLRTATVRETFVKLEVYNAGETELLDVLEYESSPDYGQIADGSINVDTTADVLRSFSLTIADPNRYWTVGPGSRLWFDRRVKLYRGYRINGAIVYWPQGVYLLSRPAIHGDRGRFIRLQGQDKSSKANGRPLGAFENPFEIAKNRPVPDAIRDCAAHATWGETKLNLAAHDGVLPYKHGWKAPDAPFTAAAQVARIPNSSGQVYRPLHYGANGYLILAPDPDPNQLSPVETFKAQEADPETLSLLVGATLEVDDDELFNAVEVVGGGGKSAVVRATAKDTSANYGVDAIGYRWYRWNNGTPDSLITTAAEAQARADYELARRLRWQQRVPVQLLEYAPLEPWDVIRIEEPRIDIAANFQLVRFTLPLATGGVMEGEAVKVVSA